MDGTERVPESWLFSKPLIPLKLFGAFMNNIKCFGQHEEIVAPSSQKHVGRLLEGKSVLLFLKPESTSFLGLQRRSKKL